MLYTIPKSITRILGHKLNDYSSGHSVTTNDENELHSKDDKPAFIWQNQQDVINIWCKNGMIHREKNPAVVSDIFNAHSGQFFYMDKTLYGYSGEIKLKIPFEFHSIMYLPLKKMNNRIFECLAGDRKQYVSMDIFHSVPDECLPV